MKTTSSPLCLFCLLLIAGILQEAQAQRRPAFRPSPETIVLRKKQYEDSLALATTLVEKARLTLRLADTENFADPDRAIELNEEAIALARQSEDPYIIVQSYLMMGNKYKRKGQSDNALQYLKRGIPWLDTSPDKKQNGFYYGQLGAIYMRRGMYEEGLKYYRLSLEAHRKVPGSEYQLAATYNNIGSLLARAGDYEGALTNRKEALALWEKTESWQHMEGCLRTMAAIYRQVGLEKEAQAALEKSRYYGEKKKKAIALPSGN